MSRENFRSRLGFILVSAGCAIGIGNVWKFPYVTGVNGGGVFVLFYIISLVIMGVPILTMELAVGRASRKSAVLGYKALEPKGSRWHIHVWLCVIGCCLLMMYYTTVSGWMLGYCFKFASGTFSGMQPSDVDTVWTDMLANPGEMTLYMVIIVLAGFMRILTEKFVKPREGRILNIHPALLPLFKGLNTHERALEAGVRVHGSTVHFVSAALDGGAIIGQAVVPVLPSDTPDTLAARGLKLEHVIYPKVCRAVLEDRVKLVDGKAVMDDETARSLAVFSNEL